MDLIEVYVPRGVFSAAEQESIARRIVDAIFVEDGSHAAEVLDSARALTQVLIHEPSVWVAGDRERVDTVNPPRYFVRITLPSAWRKEAAASLIETVTTVLADVERAAGRDPERLTRDPHAWVHVVGVPEHSFGTYGRALGSMELVDMMTRPHRDTIERLATESDDLIDPVCGMVGDAEAYTLTHEGTQYAFCSGTCRRIFADDHGVTHAAGSMP